MLFALLPLVLLPAILGVVLWRRASGTRHPTLMKAMAIAILAIAFMIAAYPLSLYVSLRMQGVN